MKTTLYMATFTEEPEGGFTVSFFDLPGCITYGETWEEALDMAEDALAHWLADQPEAIFASSFQQLKAQLPPQSQLVPVHVNQKLVSGYSKTVRVNISLPSQQLDEIDKKAKAQGLSRSEFLAKAAMAFVPETASTGDTEDR